jgi:hypothetical protein
MRLIQFLCRYGYATRKGPTVMLHIAYTQYCENINDAKFLQGCCGYYHIIPVTLFLTTMLNACLTYQEDKTMNLLISALNRFDIGATVQDETFMTTLGKNTIFALNSKLEFHKKKVVLFQWFVSPTFACYFNYSWTILVHTLCSFYYLK